MLFTEPAFLFLFVPLLAALHLIVPARARNLLLLAVSLTAYWWGEKLFILLPCSVVGNYLLGLLAGRTGRPRLARAALVFGIVANLGLLGVYKYSGFAVEILNGVLGWFGVAPLPQRSEHLPIGISFFTFQALGYVIDVYRGRVRRQTDPLAFGLFLTFFPQVCSGPISRHRDLAPQLAGRRITTEDLTAGLQRFIIGLGKKVLLANSLAATTEIVFRLPAAQLSPAIAWLGILAFMLQLYLDFAGYTDMAIGLGRMLGVRLPENFLYPYLSRTIGEMWQRWHITLGLWLRDYLYLPLGSHKRAGNWVINRNLLIVFLVCGLWHGASWNFLVWGGWNGLFLLFERTPGGRRLRQGHVLLPWLYTMLVWIVGLVLFKAGDPRMGGGLLHAVSFAGNLAGVGGAMAGTVSATALVNPELLLGLAGGIPACFPVVPWLQRRYAALRATVAGPGRDRLDRCWHYGRLVALVLILLTAVELTAGGSFSPFLYTQF